MSPRSSPRPVQTQRRPGHNTVWWISGTIVCALLFIAVYLLFVLSVPGQLIDVAVRAPAASFDHPLPDLNPDNQWIAAWILAPPAAALGLITLPGRHFICLGVAAAVVAASNVTTQVVKHLWLDRVELIPDAGTTNALPSGHTTMAASAAVAVFLAADARHRPLVGTLAAVWGAGWGAYIFIENWHRPSDMIAAYLVVAGWGLVGGWLIMRYAPQRNTLHQEVPSAKVYEALCWTVGTVLTTAAIGSLYAGGGWAGLERTIDGDHSLWHWLVGALLSVGPAFLAAAAGIRFFHREAGRALPQAERHVPGG